MFTRIDIKSFRSCNSVTLNNIGSILAIVGRNGAGKTNLLKAINTVARFATYGSILEKSFFVSSFEPFYASVDVTIGEKKYQYSIEYSPVRNRRRGQVVSESLSVSSDGSSFESVFSRQGDVLTIFKPQIELKPPFEINIGASHVSTLFLLLSIQLGETQLSPLLSPLMNFFRGVRYVPLVESDQSDEVEYLNDDAYKLWESQREATDPLDKIIHTFVYLKNHVPHVLSEVEEILGPSGLGVIDDILVGTLETPAKKGDGDIPEAKVVHVLEFTPFGHGGRSFPFSELSLGTRRVIRLVLQLVATESSVLLLEHPEDGIHRGLLSKVMGIINANANPLQVFLTSHSPFVLNAVGPENLRLVFCLDGATHVRSLNSTELSAATKHLESDGTLSEFLDIVDDGDVE